MTRIAFALAAFVISTTALQAQLRAQRITTGPTGFVQPLFGTTAPGGNSSTLYVVEKNGTIRTINTASPTATPQSFFNYTSVPGNTFNTDGEGGLLGLAFHPSYATNGRFYTFSTADGGNNLRVDQFTASGGVVNVNSRVNVVTVPHPGQTNHNGGWIGFKPGDSGPNLYIATGDGGGSNDPNNNSQNTNSLLGKLLRVNVGATGLATANTYGIPSGNMTMNPNGAIAVNPTNAVRPEIFAYGLRNPFRNSFDRGSPTGVGQGNLWIGDVGQNAREEIDYLPANRVNGTSGPSAGINYGWRLREGNVQTPSVGGPTPVDYVGPTFDYVRTNNAAPFFGSSVTGGYVYRGPAFPDATGTGGDLNGTYLFTDFISSQIGSFRTDPLTGEMIPGSVINRTSEIIGNLPAGQVLNGVATFAEDGNGKLYMMDLSNGDIFSIVPIPEPALLLFALAFAVRRRKLMR